MAYATVQHVRALDGVGDAYVYSDDAVLEGIAYAEALIDRYCGVPFEPKNLAVSLDPVARPQIFVGRPFLRTVVSCSISGVVQSVTGWVARSDGYVRRPSGTFAATSNAVTDSVELVVTYGAATETPTDIAWAARTIARQYLLDLTGRMPDRALSATSEFGTIQLAQPGGPGRPTGMPEVNAVLNRHIHRKAIG